VNRPRRIAVLVKRFPRLSETFVLNEFLELRRQGLDLRLYALMDPKEPLVHPAAAELVPEVEYLHDPSRSLHSWSRLIGGAARQAAAHPRAALRVAWCWLSAHRSRASLRHAVEGLWLAADLRRQGIDHLHAHFAHSPAAVAQMAYLAGGPPYSFTAHAKDLFTMPRVYIARRAETARFVVTCTAAGGDYLRPMLRGAATSRLHVLHHGTDLRRFNPNQRSPEPGRIISIGRLVPKKGFADLIEALRLLAQRGTNFRCEIFGTGPLREGLEKAVSNVGLGDRVTFHGARLQDVLIDAYRRACVLVLAPVMTEDGDRDGIPNVLVEAMACSVPVVSTRLSGIPELIDDGINGLLVGPGEPEALATAIERLLTDTALTQTLGLAARRKVEAGFDLSGNTEQLAEWLGAGTPTLPSREMVSEGVTVA
jgi:glycosyltransferase involved in cell wall biosynthesis